MGLLQPHVGHGCRDDEGEIALPPLANNKISVLPPNLESARKVVAKAWFFLLILTQIPWLFFAYPLLSRIFNPEWNVLINVASELAIIGLYTYCIFFLINIYIQRLSRKVGYVCPHCKNGLFQVFSKKPFLAQITGRCPTCQQLVAEDINASLDETLHVAQKKGRNKIRLINLVAAILILVGMGSRYLITANSPETHAVEMLKNKQYDQAIAEIDKELHTNPKNVVAWIIKGNIYLEMQNSDQALKDYDQALSLNPNNVDALNRRCLLRIAMQIYDPAIEDCTHALNINPKNTAAFLGRGMAYEAINQHDPALKDINEAIKLMSDKQLLYTLRGMIYLNISQLDNARKDFNKAQKLEPNAVDPLVGLGMLNAVQGFYGDAITDLEQVVQHTPVEPYGLIWLHLAKLHTHQDDTQELEQKITGVKDNKWPSSVAALYAGHTTVEAVRAQATSGYPSIRAEQACEAEYYIGEYYLQVHDRDNAKTALKSAIDSCPQAMSSEKQAAIKELKDQGF